MLFLVQIKTQHLNWSSPSRQASLINRLLNNYDWLPRLTASMFLFLDRFMWADMFCLSSGGICRRSHSWWIFSRYATHTASFSALRLSSCSKVKKQGMSSLTNQLWNIPRVPTGELPLKSVYWSDLSSPHGSSLDSDLPSVQMLVIAKKVIPDEAQVSESWCCLWTDRMPLHPHKPHPSQNWSLAVDPGPPCTRLFASSARQTHCASLPFNKCWHFFFTLTKFSQLYDSTLNANWLKPITPLNHFIAEDSSKLHVSELGQLEFNVEVTFQSVLWHNWLGPCSKSLKKKKKKQSWIKKALLV